MSRHQHGSPWPSPATRLYRPSLQVTILDTNNLVLYGIKYSGLIQLIFRHLPWKQCLINRDWLRHATNKRHGQLSRGYRSYGSQTWPIPGSGRVDTAIWMHYMEKKLNGNYTRMLWTILNKSWRQHPTKQQLYGHLPPITKTIKVRWTRHVGHC